MARKKYIPFTSQVIYRLKRTEGRPVDLYQMTGSTTDAATGDVTTTRTKIRIRRAVVLPGNAKRWYSYDRTYISANKDFTYGGLFDINSKDIIIDCKDLPKDYVVSINESIVIDGRKYKVKLTKEFDDGNAIMYNAEELKGQLPEEIIEVTMKQSFVATDVFDVTIN